VVIAGTKLFEEIDKPIGRKILSESPEETEIEASWIGELKGFNGFPDGKKVDSGNSVQGKNGVTISHWQGVFTTSDGQELLFKGRDISKNNKFVVLRTYFTNSDKLTWMNGLICVLEGEFSPNTKEFKSIGYEWVWKYKFSISDYPWIRFNLFRSITFRESD